MVLDPAWTPGPGDRSDVGSIRPWFAAGLEAHNLFAESLDLVDRWGRAAGAADILVVEGVTYWFRVREPLWHWLHERLLWRYALAAIDGNAPFESVAAPANEVALLDVLDALGRRVETIGEPQPDPAAVGARSTPSPMSETVPLRTALRGVARRLRPRRETAATTERRRRDALLDERVAMLARLPVPRVVC